VRRNVFRDLEQKLEPLHLVRHRFCDEGRRRRLPEGRHRQRESGHRCLTGLHYPTFRFSTFSGLVRGGLAGLKPCPAGVLIRRGTAAESTATPVHGGRARFRAGHGVPEPFSSLIDLIGRMSDGFFDRALLLELQLFDLIAQSANRGPKLRKFLIGNAMGGSRWGRFGSSRKGSDFRNFVLELRSAFSQLSQPADVLREHKLRRNRPPGGLWSFDENISTGWRDYYREFA